MNKRLGAKVLLAIAAVGVMTLLQGCGEEEDSFVFGMAWAPVGSVPLMEFGFGVNLGTTGAGQSATTTTGGAVAGGTQ
ncbi:MAG TPA: hypothetical protein P5205_04880 [Candidatus Paceibacterota bacterium]|nr:hypothetical protein [Verrucomicrobiota bacterium]HSA09687.1 hypothetical protein [Candidatus Paceibacterota bacterium]